MGRSRFPGKPLKFHNRKRVSVLSGAVYHESITCAQSPANGSSNVFNEEKEEEEKKENEKITSQSKETDAHDNEVSSDNQLQSSQNSSDSKSPVRTRSQIKMEPDIKEKPKVKKTVTFGTVECCDDICFPLRKIPKHHAPLVPIIKKKSSLKQTEYSTFNSILKPAKLTDLSSKIESQDGYFTKSLNILSKPSNKFTQLSESRCISPPPRLASSERDKIVSSRFNLPVRSAHSSRVIKPNKKFINNEENDASSVKRNFSKVFKKSKLRKLSFKNVMKDSESPDEEREKSSDKNVVSSRHSKKHVFDFDEDLSPDENSNLEEIRKSMSADLNEDERIRKLELSDRSSSSCSSSESETEDSWDSDAPRDSEDENVQANSGKEKVSASQLLSGKVIIREAKLQLLSVAQSSSGLDGPFSMTTPTVAPNPPTTVTCGVCGAVRFYRFVKQARKFGIYSCESCRKFISKMLKKEKLTQIKGPIIMQCLNGEGTCHVPPIVRSQQWKLLRCTNKTRCPACWLKMCLKAFQVPPSIRSGLTAMLPVYMRNGSNQIRPLTPVSPLRSATTNMMGASNIFGQKNTGTEKGLFVKPAKSCEAMTEKYEEKSKVEPEIQKGSEDDFDSRKRRLTRIKVRKKDKNDSSGNDDSKRQKMELKGPRVKHVCRSASIVLGQPIATFPASDAKENHDLESHLDDDNHILPQDDNISNPDLSSAESEIEYDNKDSQVVPDDTSTLMETESYSELRKRKLNVSVPQKTHQKEESSEDDTCMDLVPRKPVHKSAINATNIRMRAQKCDQNHPELICVDFWETYDPDEVCNSGFGIIGTAPFTVARLCFLCGSAGKEKMQMCNSCCEWYHAYCAEEAGGSGVGGGAAWTCARCAACAACGRGAARARCRACAAPHHTACLARADCPQICTSCLKCKSCDSNRVNKFVGSLPFCGPCFKLRQKGNYCPMCQACYRDNDFDSKMMECGWCARWVHASCEGLSGEEYQILSALPASVEYICCKCMPHNPPWRKMLKEHLKGKLLNLLKFLAKNKKACALLKLTPHKNTPVPDKNYCVSSPQAIRKLHFDDVPDVLKNTTETKVYRNMFKGKRNNKTDNQTWLNSKSVLHIEMKNEAHPHPPHKIVNLQEPLMQNKEICFSTGAFDMKSENTNPQIEVYDNNLNLGGNNKVITLTPTSVHSDMYEAISDDDETSDQKSVQHDSTATEMNSDDVKYDNSKSLTFIAKTFPTLLDIKKRVHNNEYVSLKEFNYDMKDVVERTLSEDLKMIYKDLFLQIFPWFDCENNCLQPNLEVEKSIASKEPLKDSEISENKLFDRITNASQTADQTVPKQEIEPSNVEENLLEFYATPDLRTCVLCKVVGEGTSIMEGRLLYCGQNDWIHANCALWSAEVFEEIDGSLQNVHSAISRGKMIKCAFCDMKGASVGCCAKNCSETYHYSCARKENCAFLDDKRVFCPTHSKEIPENVLQNNSDFALARPVYVELDKKKKRYSEINKVQFLLGSLTVHNLGRIVPPVSDFEDYLMPVDFRCSRLFWSCKKPSKIVKYTIKTKLLLIEPVPGFDYGVNITVDHSMDTQIVERVMAEIGAWHKTIGNMSPKNSFLMKSDKSPLKFGISLTLEDLAVKQVVEYLLDNVCKQEQDEEEPQNTADLLPPELKDAIFEDLNHDLLDGISMQDIFPKLMSYEDLAAMDLKYEFYGALNQSDDKSVDKLDNRSTTDFIDELLNARLESGAKELKRSKSEMILQNHNLKSLTTGRGQQRSSSLTWNNKFDTSFLSSTIKRCKIGKSSTYVSEKSSSGQKPHLSENPLDTIKDINLEVAEKKTKTESTPALTDKEVPQTSGINYRITSPKDKSDSDNDKDSKSEAYYADVIDFYTKIHCSPIPQLDGAADWSGSESSCSSRPNSPQVDFSPISQLDGADDSIENNIKNQQNQFFLKSSGAESSYTVTVTGGSFNGQPELVMRPLDNLPILSNLEQQVKCDRCHCTYRNKESYDRHIPSCDMMSTSESESENPKSPESRTLTTLQNAFHGGFAQPVLLHGGVVGSDSNVKAEGISARRTSINTRQITINGTIVETPSPGPSNEMTMTITEQVKTGTVIFDQNKNIQVSSNQQIMSAPQIVVTPQMLLPPKTSSPQVQKLMTPQIITQPGVLPYNICVKPGNATNLHQIQTGTDMAQLLTGTGGIQVISSNANQVLTLPSNRQGHIAPIIQNKNTITSFPNMASASSIALPINSIQGMPNTSIIQNIQPIIRPSLPGNSTIVVPAMSAQNKTQILIPGAQKSPKKQSLSMQSKPIFQAANRGRGRIIPKTNPLKKQTKMEKITTYNQPIGPANTVIQLQTNNNQSTQPSIIVQPLANPNIMSYVEALSQQQNHNMQYIATITPQGDFKAAPTQFISQGGFMPQTFQIQQTESGSLVAVPSGTIPVLLPQGNVGILPHTIQQGTTILPQGAISTQGIISQGPNGPTIIPQAIQTQNGATIIPQSAIQGITSGGLSSQAASLLPSTAIQTASNGVVPQSGISNGQTPIIPNSLSSQSNTLLSSAPSAALIPQGAILPQFCNDQVILGSTPTVEMVTDPSGCMYLTTQPVYYGLETIVQNTVMSSQQFVSTAMQGVLAQNSSFSATTTQVFQASKIEPIVEVPTGYVVVNNIGDNVTPQVSSTSSAVTPSSQAKNLKTPIPNLTLQPLPDKSTSGSRQGTKIIQMSSTPISGSYSSVANVIPGRQSINPITTQIQNLSLAVSTSQNFQKNSSVKCSHLSPNVTLVSSTGQPIMAISQSVPHSVSSFSIQSVPFSQPIVSSSVAPSPMRNNSSKLDSGHTIEISGTSQENLSSTNITTTNITHHLKSPTPWKQVATNAVSTNENKIDSNMTRSCNNSSTGNPSLVHMPGANNRLNQQNINEMKLEYNPSSLPNSSVTSLSHQFVSNMSGNQFSAIPTSNNIVQNQISNGQQNVSTLIGSNFNNDAAYRLSKINTLSKAEGSMLNFAHEIMPNNSHQHLQNDKNFNLCADIKHDETRPNIDKINSSCQIASNNLSAMPMLPQNMRQQISNNQNLSSSCLHNHTNVTNNENINNRNNIFNSNETSLPHNSQHLDISMAHGVLLGNNNVASNQIHIMNGQIQNNRFQENVPIGQNNIGTNKIMQDNNFNNHSIDIHNFANGNILSNNPSSMNLQHNTSNSNNRMVLNNSHTLNNMNNQILHNRESSNEMQIHNMQQTVHFTNNNRAQIDHNSPNMAINQNTTLGNISRPHQHAVANMMQTHPDNNLISVHQHASNQMNRISEANMHMHHMTNMTNGNLNNPSGNSNSLSSTQANRHDIMLPNINSLNPNQVQNNRNTFDHSSAIQHQNINMHNNLNNPGSINHQTISESIMHIPNISDGKHDGIQNSCMANFSVNNSQFSHNQSFEMTSGQNMSMSNNLNNLRGMNNASNVANNLMVNDNVMYRQNNQTNMGHDTMMNCNMSDQNANAISNNLNLIMSNNNHTQTNSNQNCSPMNNMQMNVNNCNMTLQNQMYNVDNQININSSSMDTRKFTHDNARGKNLMQSANANLPISNMSNNDCIKVTNCNSILNHDKSNHSIPVNNQIGFLQMNSQGNRIINLPDRNKVNTNVENNLNHHISQQHSIQVVNNTPGLSSDSLAYQQKNDNSTLINVPFQSIPNSAPMNINVNSSNNTVNITVQNNLVDPKLASKSSDVNFSMQNSSNLLNTPSNTNNMICIPMQGNTINLPTQSSNSISLPKAPPTQQSGIPTNVVNPMSMRPMNRVLPLHRDGHNKLTKSSTTKTLTSATQRPTTQDMPDLNIKDENVDSDFEKAIEESKRTIESERAKREKEEIDLARAIQMSAEIDNNNTINQEESRPNDARKEESIANSNEPAVDNKSAKALTEKNTNRRDVPPKLPVVTQKMLKRPLSDKKTDVESVATKKPSKLIKGQENKGGSIVDAAKDDGPKLIFEVSSDDGFTYSSTSLTDLWAKVVEAVQLARKQAGMSAIQYNLPVVSKGTHILGFNNNALRYLIEQLPGAKRCKKYKMQYGQQYRWDKDLDLSDGFRESQCGSARVGPISRKHNHDMFSWMASSFREEPPPYTVPDVESSVSRRLATLPPAMRFRQLKETSKVSVGVYRSHIHGRGLFCKKDIEEGDMVIEYAGEVIRAAVADQRERRYEGSSGRRGVGGCYMFRIDDNLVVDATLKGNAARFINHSCDPNCYSRVVDIHGHKHILIFALRRIGIGEELTYDYKFPFEEVKIPCTCGAKKCRKYLN